MEFSNFINALNNKNSKKIPIWLIRQAGRYLPGYRRLREKYTFVQLAKEPELATKVTLEPIELFDLDAAIVFSDILFLLEALGAKVEINNSPIVTKTNRIRKRKYEELDEYFKFLTSTIKLIKSKTKKPLLGFTGGIYTLFSYVVSSYLNSKLFIYKYPQIAKKYFDILSDAIFKHLKIQEKAGCDAVVIFDTLASELPHYYYMKLLNYYKKINLKIPLIIYAKGFHKFEALYTFASSIIIDSNTDISELKKYNSSYQGNLDPYILLCGGSVLIKEVDRIISIAASKGYIFNLSAGVLPKTEPKNVEVLVNRVKKWNL
ncbi:MAG: hypothetical protein NZ870_00905 [bacterium]|nr:hypothetical protein [bacterium]